MPAACAQGSILLPLPRAAETMAELKGRVLSNPLLHRRPILNNTRAIDAASTSAALRYRLLRSSVRRAHAPPSVCFLAHEALR